MSNNEWVKADESACVLEDAPGSNVPQSAAIPERLPDSQVLIDALLASSDYAVLLADSEGRITRVNDCFTRLSGYRANELVADGRNPFEFRGVDPGEQQNNRRALANGESVRCQQVFLNADNNRYCLELTFHPLQQADNNPSGWLIIGHDVTAHVNLQEHFYSHATRLQLTLESARMGTWEVNNRTGEVIVDDSWLGLARVDKSKREQAGAIWRSRIHPDDRARMEERIDGAIDTGDVQRSQYRVKHKDGSVRWMQDTSRVTERDADGKPVRLVGVVADITSLKEAVAAAQTAAVRLSLATEAAGLGIWDHNIQSNTLFWNQRMCEIQGMDAVCKSADEYAALILPDDREHVAKTLMAGRKSGKPFEMKYRISRPDGEVRNVEVLAKYHYLTDGTPCRLIGITRDVTEQIRQDLERQQAQKLESVGRLAAGIAHEINTPAQYVSENIRFAKEALELLAPLANGINHGADAAALQAALELLMQNNEAPYLLTEAPIAIGEALDGMQRIGDIVTSMKTFSHPGNSRVPLDINKSITSARTISRSEWLEVAEVETRLDPDLPMTSVVAGEFNQVVLNLIVNAAHAIAERQANEPDVSGHIQIATKHHDDMICLEISDNGCGITPENQKKIFDPFFTTKPVGLGTGQGLALVHSFVKSHDGKIEMQSRPGSGTRIIVWLPVESVS